MRYADFVKLPLKTLGKVQRISQTLKEEDKTHYNCSYIRHCMTRC